MKYLILFGLLGIIYLIYRGVSKYLDYAAKVLLTVLPVSAIVYLLTINMPYNIEVVFLFLASLSVKANELPLAFICIIICIVAMVILVVGLA